jgi:DNA-binding MarR family transcriptional regulator
MTLMDKVAVNRACKVLEERGLAWRRPNAQDGRSHLLELTGEGVRMHDEIMPLALEMERRLFSNFAPEEIDQFRRLLQRVRGEVKDLDADDIDSGTSGSSEAT